MKPYLSRKNFSEGGNLWDVASHLDDANDPNGIGSRGDPPGFTSNLSHETEKSNAGKEISKEKSRGAYSIFHCQESISDTEIE